MDFNIKKHHNDLLFIPLGGAGEIGMNLNLYHFQGKFIIIDMGIGFADVNLPGVDIVVPNINFLIQNRKNIIGMVLTHAHEDHIGAVSYLWEELQCPIYTTKFTAAVLKAKFKEFTYSKNPTINILKSNSNFSLSPFTIEMIEITHSIPEMNGLVIKTSKGNIFHTGDWKLDPSPIVSDVTDEKKLKEIGDQGVLAMVGDSTNIFNSGTSGSEGALSSSLESLIKDYKNLVVVTTFASNVARLHSIAKAAENSGRKVVLLGKSLWRIYNAARDTGYLADIKPCLKDTEISKHKKQNLLIICTGCQGEELAAASKLANEIHPKLKLQKNDTIIFSSKIIPGNEKKIFSLFNKLCHIGVEVLTEKDHFVHVSGHPYKEEVCKMYELIRPKVAIPVHGEAIHLHEHCKLAKEKGIKEAIEVQNGDVILLDKSESKKIASVESGYFAVDGNFILDSKNPILKIRNIIGNHGAVFIALVINKKNKLSVEPAISTPGLIDEKEDAELIDSLKENIKSILLNLIKNDDFKIKKSILSSTKKILKKEINKEPFIVINIVRV